MEHVVTHPQSLEQDLPAHQQTFQGFTKLVVFAVLHVTLVLGCLALAFLGHTPVLATLLGIGGTIALVAIIALV